MNVCRNVFIAVNPRDRNALTNCDKDQGSASAIFVHYFEYILTTLRREQCGSVVRVTEGTV